MSTLKCVLGGAAAVAAVYGVYAYVKQMRARKAAEAAWAAWVPPYDPAQYEVLTLHPHEASMVWPMLPTTTTLTFFEGNPDEAIPLIKRNVAALAKANPWLCGRLVKHPGPVHDARLWIPHVVDASQLFMEFESATLVPGQAWHEVDDALKALMIPEGCHCMDKDRPLFGIIVVRTPGAGSKAQFAVLAMLSHMLGDGHTFYRLYESLGLTQPVKLNVARKPGTYLAKLELMGKRKFGWVSSAAHYIGMIRNIYIHGGIRTYARYVDEGVLKAEKAKWADPSGEVPWVSSSDVLTSILLSTGDYDNGVMYVGTRNRLSDGATDSDAGNYVMPVLFWPDEYAKPTEIRRTLTTKTYNARRPDVMYWKTNKGNFGVVSNWASFQRDLTLPGCKQVIHYPLPPKWTCSRETHYIFRPTPDTLAVVHLERTDRNGATAVANRATHPAFGELVYGV